jgi:hypothetical protein
MNDSEADTKPTIETVIERINALGSTLRNELKAMREELQIRLDRIEGVTSQTRAEMLTLRADFREFLHSQVKRPAA